MHKFQINSRYDSSLVIYECELTERLLDRGYSFQLLFAVKQAIKEGESLNNADLSGACLASVDLTGVTITGADFTNANLRYSKCKDADFRYSCFRRADFMFTDLTGAKFANADFTLADFTLVNFTGSNLKGAIFKSANFSKSYLKEANLGDIREDFTNRLSEARNEVLKFYDYLMKGKVDGSVYEGQCADFCGTIANIRKEKYDEMSIGLRPEEDSLTERWFLAIKEGDTPQNNQVAAITAEWMREFMDKEGIEYPEYKIVPIYIECSLEEQYSDKRQFSTRSFGVGDFKSPTFSDEELFKI